MSSLMDYPDGASPLDPDEMEGLSYKHITTRGELDELEQANIVEGMQWLKKQKNPDVLMDERRDQYIAALRAADGHDFSALLKFVGE